MYHLCMTTPTTHALNGELYSADGQCPDIYQHQNSRILEARQEYDPTSLGTSRCVFHISIAVFFNHLGCEGWLVPNDVKIWCLRHDEWVLLEERMTP